MQILVEYKPTVLFDQHKSDIVNNSSPSIRLLQKAGYNTFYSVDKTPSFGFGLMSEFISLFISQGYRCNKVDQFEPKLYELLIAY